MRESCIPNTRLLTDDMALKLERLKQLSSDGLRTEWRRFYRSEPPPRIGRDLMIRAVAHKMQEQAFGGLKGPVKRKLKALMETIGSGKCTGVAGAAVLKPGMRLMREWRGQRYDVLILDSGFEYRGRTYQSLTAIAGEITGTHWSGPRFFGLKRPTKDIESGQCAASVEGVL
jgi:hypothetical protein